jgi:hypothetical protein
MHLTQTHIYKVSLHLKFVVEVDFSSMHTVCEFSLHFKMVLHYFTVYLQSPKMSWQDLQYNVQYKIWEGGSPILFQKFFIIITATIFTFHTWLWLLNL